VRVGFIGLGSQGGPMARRILEAGFATTLWARREATLEPFAGTTAGIAASPAVLGRESDLVCVCVVDDAGVEEVLRGERDDGVLAGMRPGGIVAIHSTVHPATCRRLAEHAAARGVALLEAPVSGGGGAASERRLLVMVGGEADAFERARPVFATYGDPVLHLGPVGSGQTAKLLNNLVFTAQLGIATKVFEVGRALGVEAAALAEVLASGSGRSYGLELTSGMGFTAAPLAAHAGPLLQKDVGIAAEVARDAAVDLGVLLAAADAALAVLQHPRGSAAGH
jgi:3-hydroxyisobutyrate dehydrogenase-like beta-hydroxyacid dehydrogenase